MTSRATALVLTQGLFKTPSAKTAHGLVRGPSRFELLGLVDAASASSDAGVELDGKHRGIPVYPNLDAALAALTNPPDFVVIGVATSGGVLPAEMRSALLSAVERGIGVVNGLHEFLGDDPAFVAAAARAGVSLIDVRRPKPRRDLHFWSGAIRDVRAPRVAVLGTDCALGKRTTCHVLSAACREAGLVPAIVHTGQTGWLQGIPHGFVLDSTPNDFVSGELEHAVVSCDRELSPDVIFLEGQSGLLNPSGPCGAELILSAEARGVVLQHAPGRIYHDDQEHLHNAIAPLEKQIALIEMYGARVLGITLNDEGTPPSEREAVRAAIERETALPTIWPLAEGASRLVPLLRALVDEVRRA